MNFDLSDDQRLLVDTAASFAKKESPVERLRRLREDELGFEPKVWRNMGELGWLGIPFPEDLGGFGGRFVDAALVIEQLGTTLVPEPYIPVVILGGMTLLRAGSAEQHKRWLVPLITGETIVALAHSERDSRYAPIARTTRAERTSGGYSLTGEKVFVLAGHAADHLIVSAALGDGDDAPTGLFVVDRGAANLTINPVKTLDGQRAAMVRLAGVEVAEDCVLGPVASGAEVIEDILDLGAAAACAEGLGIAATVLDMTVEYLKTREQFGVQIGTFQALQHRAVDIFIEVELCRSMMIAAAIEADSADRAQRMATISAAKVQLAQGGRYVVRQGVQLHGGIGCTDEHDISLYFKRMQALGALFGDEEFHTARFAQQPGFTADLTP